MYSTLICWCGRTGASLISCKHACHRHWIQGEGELAFQQSISRCTLQMRVIQRHTCGTVCKCVCTREKLCFTLDESPWRCASLSSYCQKYKEFVALTSPAHPALDHKTRAWLLKTSVFVVSVHLCENIVLQHCSLYT